MKKIRCSPILICRTKYIDYPTGKPFCSPKDLDLRTFDLLLSMMSNGQNLSPNILECKIFINDGNHCVIGKYAFIEDVIDDAIKSSLDFLLDGVKPAWGFIGTVIKTDDFISFGKAFDLPDSYYVNAYIQYLYNEHWLERQFLGTYHYPYVEENVELIDTANLEIEKSEKGYIIETDDKNSVLFAFTVNSALAGEKVSFCTNAEYNASRLISENKVDIVTVSAKNLNMHKAKLQTSSETKKETVHRKQENIHSGFAEEADIIYEKDNPNKKNNCFKLLGLYFGCKKIENSEFIFDCKIGKYRFFIANEKQMQTKENTIRQTVSFEKPEFNKKDSHKDKYKF